VLALPWFKIQTKFSVDFLYKPTLLVNFLNIKFYLSYNACDIVGGFKSSNQRTLVKFELFTGWTFPQVLSSNLYMARFVKD